MDTTRQTLKIFTEDEIIRITCNYSTLIGKGGFGEVYKGNLDDDYDLVAVKRYIRDDLREEFIEEVSIHGQINHKNVVKLIGYCIGESTLTMVTEYISKGNLEDTLHNSDISLSLDIRLGIAIGCAEALSYMHSMHLSSGSLICHGDIKRANILLDDNLTAKISDFGLSRLLFGGITRYTTNVKGSIDYMDPIYFQKGRLTPRSDVYSFGIVLLELISRRRVKEGNSSLIEIFSKSYSKEKGMRQLFDAEIENVSNLKILDEIGTLAVECLTLDIDKRPQMNDVVERLRMLRKVQKGGQEKTSWRLFWGTQNAWQKDYKQSRRIYGSILPMQRKKSLPIFKRTSGSSEIPSELDKVKLFTNWELSEVTQNYSYRIGGTWSGEVYKGRLEDNTVVTVNYCCVLDDARKDNFINEVIILSQINHKNIIKLLGCCWEDDAPILVYEYATKGRLSSILRGAESLPLEIRMKMALNTAEALEYLHSTATGVIRHGYVQPSQIFLDDNFIPKISGFLYSTSLAKNSDDWIICAKTTFTDPVYLQSGLLTVKNDVYSFGLVLLQLITRKYPDSWLMSEFIKNYDKYDSGKVLFDIDITAEEDIATLEEIGRLVLKCMSMEVDERPEMEEVAECLRMRRKSWKKSLAQDCTELTESEATKVDAPLGLEISDLS